MVRPVATQTITVSEAAQRLGVSRPSAYRAVRRGELPVLKIGKRLLVPLGAFNQLLASPRIKPKAEAAIEEVAAE